jgi:Asp-tRNA(Asn)/Glu-tRNA(Gln) amidotransferase C subunit
MISKEEIKKLSNLARIEVKEEEIEGLGKDISSILEYVGQVKSAVLINGSGFPSPDQGEGERSEGGVNVFREDENPTESGTHSKELIAEFPENNQNYLKVKKIL